IKVVTYQPIRAEVHIHSFSVGRGRGRRRTADVVDLFDLWRRHDPAPEHLAGALMNAQGSQVLRPAIKFRKENASFRNNGRRKPGPDRSFPEHVLIRTKFNGWFPVADSRRIWPPELRPLRRACEIRQEDGDYNGPRNSFHAITYRNSVRMVTPISSRWASPPGSPGLGSSSTATDNTT